MGEVTNTDAYPGTPHFMALITDVELLVNEEFPAKKIWLAMFIICTDFLFR